MESGRFHWREWARTLQRWNLCEPAAVLLEAAGPLTLFLAQCVYFGEPLLGQSQTTGRWRDLAHLLESQEESRDFAAFLRKEDQF